jgi:transposase
MFLRLTSRNQIKQHNQNKQKNRREVRNKNRKTLIDKRVKKSATDQRERNEKELQKSIENIVYNDAKKSSKIDP